MYQQRRPASRHLRRFFAVVACLAATAVTDAHQAPPQPLGQGGMTPALSLINAKWIGDYDGMLKRRRVRILTPYSKTHYFIDKGVQYGIVYDAGVRLEQSINARLKTTPATKVHVVFVPTSRDALLAALTEGRGDIVAANLIVTPEREKLADFTIAARTGVRQIAVTGPGAPPLASLSDLAGKQIAVRDKSLQFDGLTALNVRFKNEGRPPVAIKTVPTALEDEDILEMVSSGLLKATIVDSDIAELWAQVLRGLTLHPTVAVMEGGANAWAVRKGSPKLLAMLNQFVKANREGTAFGNQLLRKYLENVKFVKSATSEAELQKFRGLVDVFRKYGGRYKVDYVLMIAQGYQESQLNQDAKSQVGAIGIMQVMPATGKDLQVGDIKQIDANVHAGVKYVRFMIDQYFANEPIDETNKILFAFAAYNCGPARLRQLRRETARRGLDANLWFNNVERVVGERIGRETVQYVSNIYKYYVAYTLTLEDWHRDEARKPGGTQLRR
jgi:membrane-bound lytic murein transglycosylase MltF